MPNCLNPSLKLTKADRLHKYQPKIGEERAKQEAYAVGLLQVIPAPVSLPQRSTEDMQFQSSTKETQNSGLSEVRRSLASPSASPWYVADVPRCHMVNQRGDPPRCTLPIHQVPQEHKFQSLKSKYNCLYPNSYRKKTRFSLGTRQMLRQGGTPAPEQH